MGNLFKYIIICMGFVSCINTQQQTRLIQYNSLDNKQMIQAFQDSILKSHPEWSDSVKKRIYNHNVTIGMTSNMVIAALGLPIYTDKTEDAGISENRYGYSEMYFTNTKEFTNIEKIRPFLLEPTEYVYINKGKVSGITKSH